jgi:dienelactone hydrolase
VRRALALLWVNGLLLGIACASETPRVLERAPASPDPTARYLFYLHGRIIEVQGPDAVSPDFGRYEYRRILEALAEGGFVVVSEVREDGAGAAFVEATVRQVQGLLDAGVSAHHVTVVGFSKGGFMALGVAAKVASDDVGYVILAGCSSDPDWAARQGSRIRGRFLSLHDRSDRFSPSCATLFAKSERVQDKTEHVFETGLDHGLFYRPRADWLDHVVAWAHPDASPSADDQPR